MRPLIVVPYDSAWPLRFAEAASELRFALDDDVVGVHHIGSTAIPGMAAKPVIDILLVVRDIQRLAETEGTLGRIGYQPRGENGIPGRRYFVKESGGHRTHQVHAFEIGHPAISEHLALREYLITHAEDAQEYADLKLRLAERFPEQRERYVEGKAPLLAELKRKALAWNADRVV